MRDKIVWMDLEMTGLDPAIDEIIEIASIVTDSQLNIIAEGPTLIVHQENERFAKMDKWNQKQHTKSGLWQKVLESNMLIDEAEKLTLDFIKKHTEARVCLAGNSIWQDRRFIRKYMPSLDNYLHYRMIDVTSIKIVSNFWFPKKNMHKKEAHRALDDIKESILELKFYKENVFNSLPQKTK